MSRKIQYMPILKWKAGEQRAVKELESKLKDRIIPLFLMAPIPWDFEAEDYKCTLDQHLTGFGQKLCNVWQSNQPVMIDAEQLDYELMADGTHPIEFIVTEAENFGIPAIPVTGMDKSKSYNDAVKALVKKYAHGLAIRIKQQDFQDISTTLPKLIKKLSVQSLEVDLVFDCEEITEKNYSSIKDAVIAAFKRIPNLSSYRSIAVGATAFPKSLLGIPKYTVKTYPRCEWLLWKQLIASKEVPKNIIFSDYTIDDPNWPDQINPRLLFTILNGNIRYTHSESWYVAKGEKVYSQTGFRQYPKVCSLIISHPDNIFSGQNYSAGDTKIFECANRRGSNGNLTTWVQVGVNHHITFVLNQLANSGGASNTP